MPKATLLVLTFYVSLLPALAQDSLKTRLTTTGFDKQYFKSGFLDARDVVTAPARWKEKQWLTATAVVASTGMLMIYDDEIKSFAQRNRTSLSNEISEYGLEPWGSGWYSIPLVGGIYLQGLIWQNDRSKKTALLCGKSLAITAGFTYFHKYLFQRKRPNVSDDPYQFQGPLGEYEHTSFISGHSSAIFSIASVIAFEYKNTKWVPAVAYSIASLAALSRIHDNKHWASDVLAGSAFGWAVGQLVCRQNNWGIQLTPVITDDSAVLYFGIPVN